MGNPIPAQERSVDPYSSYNSNVVNKLTRIISDGKHCLLMPSPITVEKISNVIVRSSAGKAIKDDVLIEVQNLTIDLADPDYYVNTTTGIWNEDGYYYVVLVYSYEKESPAPRASIEIIKPSQRNTVYNPDLHLFINCLRVASNIVIDVLDYDPDNMTAVKRQTAGSGSSEITIELDGGGTRILTTNADNIGVDTTNGNTTLLLPPTSSANKIIRIIKMTDDPNDVVITRSEDDTIEGLLSISLERQYDAVTLLPFPTRKVWIQV